MKKRIVAAILTSALIVTQIPMSVWAETPQGTEETDSVSEDEKDDVEDTSEEVDDQTELNEDATDDIIQSDEVEEETGTTTEDTIEDELDTFEEDEEIDIEYVNSEDLVIIDEGTSYDDTLDMNVGEDELLQAYIDAELLYDNEGSISATYSSSINLNKLTNIEKALYTEAKNVVARVAIGSESDTRATVSATENMSQTTWTAADLGMTVIYDPSRGIDNRSQAVAAWKNIFNSEFDFSRIMYSVIHDCPYELYWAGLGYQYGLSNGRNQFTLVNGEYVYTPSYDVYFRVSVSDDYADMSKPVENGRRYYVDTTKTGAVSGSITNARNIVSQAAGKTDLEKLNYYAEQICDLVDYNYAAVNSGYYSEYGNPWQLIYVFDGDPTTKVVCEGYSKAFQYLCEMTMFDNPEIYCYSVSGNMVAGATSGPHMWNIVHMDDGYNYLVDVTNCDNSVINKSLFLVPAYSGNPNSEYIVYRSESGGRSTRFEYTYDNESWIVYTEDELTLSMTAYDQSATKTFTVNFDTMGAGIYITPERVDEGTMAIDPGTVTRNGYILEGWYTSGTNQIPSTKWNFSSDAVNSAITLYAKWEPITYTIHFDGNGSDGGSMSDITATYNVPVTLPYNAFTNDVFAFTGWNTRGDGLGTNYSNGQTVKNLASNQGDIVTFFACWETGYGITYVLNGGTNAPSNPAVFAYSSPAITFADPTRPGYSFGGWFTSSSCSSKTKITGIPTHSSKPVTVYAKWNANKYTITFNGNGSKSGSTKNVSATYGTNVSLTKNGFARPGYTFIGWNTATDGSGMAFSDRQSVNNLTTVSAGYVTLYAQWSLNTYTISYVDDGYHALGISNPTTYTYETPTIVLDNPTRTGYTFEGWYTDRKFKAKNRVSSITNGTSNLTLYGKWAPNKYTIVYDKNGAPSGSMKNSQATYGANVSLLKVGYTRPGYTFTGWNTASDGSGTDYPNRASVRDLSIVNGDVVTLYAQWSLNTYTISYVNDGDHPIGVINPTSYTYETPTIVLDNPTRTGYTFEGWYSDRKFKAKNKVTSITHGTSNLTLYGKWSPNKYTIVYDKNGAPSGSMKNTSATFGSNVSLTKLGYSWKGFTFTGWNTAADGTGTYYSNRQSVRDLTLVNGGTVTLYAQWSPNSYSINYVLNGGTNSVSNITSYTADMGTISVDPATRSGYAFDGWYTSSKLTGSRVTSINTAQAANVTLYAKWVAMRYTICFDGNGADYGVMANLAATGGKAVALSPVAFVRNDYVFTGWNTASNGSGIDYTDRQSVTNLCSNDGDVITLYAQWTPVDILAASVRLNATQVRQAAGTTYQLTANVLPVATTDKSVVWTSSDDTVASVDSTGLVTLNNAGIAIIKASTTDGATNGQCLIQVDGGNTVTLGANYVNVDDYIGPHISDTGAINKAIKELTSTNNVLYIPSGTYDIDADYGIQLKSNITIIMDSDTILKAVPNSASNYNMFNISGVSNVTISGGQIVGDRASHTGTAGEWGFGFGIYDSTNIRIDNVVIKDFWGDGIYLGSHNEASVTAGCSNIQITNCTLSENRRNNLSIVAADNVIVDGCLLEKAAGTDPEYGADIETNNQKNPCEHISFYNCSFENNNQGSMGIVTVANDVEISGCNLGGSFINYAGNGVNVNNSDVNADIYSRIGLILGENVRINDGSSVNDILVASYSADSDPGTWTEYNINSSNQMNRFIIDDSRTESGKALKLIRTSTGTQEAGYMIDLSDITSNAGTNKLAVGQTYRFEYVMRGTGLWGIKTTQTGWYPCVMDEDRYLTGFVTYTAYGNDSCNLMLYAVDKTQGMFLDVESIKVYLVK